MICQEDSYKKELATEVIVSERSGDTYFVELADSLFYPEGGGQPADSGWIGSARVEDVQKKDGRVICRVDQELPLGSYKAVIDWDARFDSMQQHTGQHLLTALILKNFGWKTVGFHISDAVSTIDLDTPQIQDEDCTKIEELVQRAILEAHPVRTILVSREECDEMSIRTRGIPDWVIGDIRLIEIEGIDINNCGGTHVRNTLELQHFAIVGREKLKKKTRISFVFGSRLRHMLHRFLHKEKRLNQIFQEGNHVERAQVWAEERKEHKLERKRWSIYRAENEGQKLASNPEDVVIVYFPEQDLGELKLILSEACARAEQKSFILFSNSVFVSTLQSEEKYGMVQNVFREAGGKGGGRFPMLQGKWEKDNLEDMKQRFISVFQ